MIRSIIAKLLALVAPQPLRIVERAGVWRDRDRAAPPWGAMIHTTGRNVHRRALEWRCTPEEAAMRIWDQGKEGPAYVIALDGTVYRYQPDEMVGRHARIEPEHRARMLADDWRGDCAATGVRLWSERWPEHRSPQHLYPTRSPNGCYIGVELVPLDVPRVEVVDGQWWYTSEQMAALARLLRELAARHGWPPGWSRSPRLLGHEDAEPYRRWDAGGGWDPGALRPLPRFDWAGLLKIVE
jgi:hypothetical protein